MAYKEYSYGAYAKETKELLRKRLQLRDRIRYHEKKIEMHKEKIEDIINVKLIEIEEKLNKYFDKSPNCKKH